jgi:hypothetical protein
MTTLEKLILGLRHFDEIELGSTDFTMEMRPGFPQPSFYQELFPIWGLDAPE